MVENVVRLGEGKFKNLIQLGFSLRLGYLKRKIYLDGLWKVVNEENKRDVANTELSIGYRQFRKHQNPGCGQAVPQELLINIKWTVNKPQTWLPKETMHFKINQILVS